MRNVRRRQKASFISCEKSGESNYLNRMSFTSKNENDEGKKHVKNVKQTSGLIVITREKGKEREREKERVYCNFLLLTWARSANFSSIYLPLCVFFFTYIFSPFVPSFYTRLQISQGN